MYLKFIKQILDTIFATIILVIISPILLIIAIWIKIDSKGSIIFKQKRIGANGKNYNMYKFRTMIENAQNIGTGVYSFNGDPRITKAGKVLRKTSLDELPQIINIIKGDMSFVGPRPPVYGHFPEYETLKDEYKKRFEVKPGITGLSQCMGRNELSWDEKMFYDNTYVDNIKKYGFLYDVKICFLTIKRVFSMKNIEETEENMKKNQEALEKMVKKEEENV